MDKQESGSLALNGRSRPQYFPWRPDQKIPEERYAHVIGDGYKITKVGSDKNEQELFRYEDCNLKFYLIATQFSSYDWDSRELAQAHFDYYKITDWPLKDQRSTSGKYSFSSEPIEKYKRNIGESLFLFGKSTTKVEF